MKFYIIFITDGSDPEPLREHVYLSKERADRVRDELYNNEIKRRIDLLTQAIKIDPNAQWHYDHLMMEIKDEYFGNLNPLYEVREFTI